MDQLGGMLGLLMGYGSPAIILFCFAFVLAKSTGKTWPYVVAAVLTVMIYALLMLGWNHLKATGQ
jgi:hypothetical protein